MRKTLLAILAVCAINNPEGALSQSAKIKEVSDLILKLCLADSTQIEISQDKNSVAVSGNNDSVTIKKNEVVGLAGGISSSLSTLSAQQASEARACTKQYLKKIVDALLSNNEDEEAAKEKFGDIHILTQGNPACIYNFSILMNDMIITPLTTDWVVKGMKLGQTKWIIRGNASCGGGVAFCASNADNQTGNVELQSEGRYFVSWQIIPGSLRGSECQFALLRQS